MEHTLILVSAGESEWKTSDLFTGWIDVLLSKQGVEEADLAGRQLKREKVQLDLAYTSYLKRGIDTLNHILAQMDQEYIPVVKSWKLNERHYGALEGISKRQTAEAYGAEQVQTWRRAYDVEPPAVDEDDDRNPVLDPRYRKVDPAMLPRTESIKDVSDRVAAYYEETIAPSVMENAAVLVCGHSNSIRALIGYLDGKKDEEITKLEIAPASPRIYTLGDDLAVKGVRDLF